MEFDEYEPSHEPVDEGNGYNFRISFFFIFDFLQDRYNQFTMMLENIFWYMQHYWYHAIFVAIVSYYLWTKVLRPFVKPICQDMYQVYDKYEKTKEEREYAAKYHKNPDLLAERVFGQQEFVQKLQDKYKKDAERFLSKQEEKQERKRQEILNLINGNTNRLDQNYDDGKQKKLRSEYNPLNPSSSSNYRPQRKSACSGGGCGRN